MKDYDWLDYVLEHTKADFAEGHIYWTIRMKGRQFNKPLGCLDSNGYIKCSVAGTMTYGHILMWIHATHDFPSGMIDHINRIRHDNKLSNLRLTTPAENMLNRPVTSNNQTGVRGVYFTPSGKYRVTIAGKYLGTFTTLVEAEEVVYGTLV
jgi:hypothetical protein